MAVHFMRHAQSLQNIGMPGKNPSLSDFGKYQSSLIEGDYDIVIVSNLKRTLETLRNSKIKFKEMIVTELCREHKNASEGDYLEHEDVTDIETDDDLFQRFDRFNKFLNGIRGRAAKILVISHAIFLIRFLNLGRGLCNCELIT